MSLYYKPLYKRDALQKHIFKLFRLKKRLWKRAIISKDYAAFMQARRNVQAAIRHFRCSHEHRLIFNNNRKKFYDHICKKSCAQKRNSRLTCNGETMSDLQSAEIFLAEFASFSSSIQRNNIKLDNFPIPNDNCFRMFNCTEHLVKEALCKSSNSNS